MDQFSLRPISPAATSLDELAELVAATGLTETTSDLEVSGICLSSAAVLPGDLFVALPGERTHGARYVDQAVTRGAVAVVTDRAGAETISGCGVPVLVVPDPRSVLGALSAAVFQDPSRRLKMIGVTGTQGIGVSTPDAAAVADATAGLEGVMHMPNDMMLTKGTWSMMFAAGWLPDMTRFTGSTVSGDVPGGTAIAHFSSAPLTTWIGMPAPLLPTQPPVAWISTRRFSPASGSAVFSNWLSPLPTARSRDAATPLSIR